MKIESELAKNISKLLMGNLSVQVLSLLLMPVITRIFLPETLGAYASYLSLAVLLSILGTGQFHAAAHIPKKDSVAFGLAQCSFYAIFISTTMYTSFALLLKYMDQVEMPISLLVCLSCFYFIYCCNEILKTQAVRFKAMGVLAWAMNISRLTALGGKILLGFKYPWVLTLLVADLIGVLLSSFYFLFQLRKKGFGAKKPDMNGALTTYTRFALYSIPSKFIQASSFELPVLLLSSFLDLKIVGAYVVFHKLLVAPTMILTNSVNSSLSRELAEENNFKTSLDTVRLLIFWILVLSTPFVLLLYFYGTEIISWVLGPGWRQSALLISQLAFFAPIKIINGLFQNFYVTKQLLRAELLFKVVELLAIVTLFSGIVVVEVESILRLYILFLLFHSFAYLLWAMRRATIYEKNSLSS